MSTVTINDRPVTAGTAAWFEGLRYAFRERFGLDLIVTSGLRTRTEQQRLYEAWRGGKGSYAVPPGTSRHETGRALDLRDSGSDPGVTVAGTTRSTWLRDHSPQYGFTPAGFAFAHSEPWHYELAGTLEPHTPPTTPTPITKKEDDPMLINIQGHAGTRHGGTYYIAAGHASLLGPLTKGLPTLNTTKADELAKRVTGI